MRRGRARERVRERGQATCVCHIEVAIGATGTSQGEQNASHNACLRDRKSGPLPTGSLPGRLRAPWEHPLPGPLGGICLGKSSVCNASRQKAASPRPLSPPGLAAAAAIRGGPWDVAQGTRSMCNTGCPARPTYQVLLGARKPSRTGVQHSPG